MKPWLIAFALVVMAVLVSYQWLDRPISFFAHDVTAHYDLFRRLTLVPEWMESLAAVILVVVGIRSLTGRLLTFPLSVTLLCAVSLVAAEAVKDQLKYVFGRTWPETWVRDNPSLIRDGVFGFNPFHGGPGYASFPSGHTTAICAVVSVLWICYPRFRPLYVLGVLAVAVGLIGANYHFLSDVIAGAFLGSSSGWIAVRIWRAGEGRLARRVAPVLPPVPAEAAAAPADGPKLKQQA